jgi:capsular polysaccharide biosynthesis protein
MADIRGYATDFNSYNIFFFLWKKRRVLLFICITAVVVSSIVSYIIEPKFKSTVILFPSSTSSISKSLLSEISSSKHDIMQFGEEEDAEQLLQILNSDEIRNKIVEKYHLMDHYKINAEDPYKYTKLFEKFDDNISFKRTEFMSVKIQVLDKDPIIAAKIANDIASLVDTVKNRIQKERALQGFRIVEQEYQNIIAEIKTMEDSLEVLRSLGVIDYTSQAEKYAEQYAIALTKGDRNGSKAMEEKLNILAEYGGAYMNINDNLEHDRKQLRTIKTKYDEAKVDAEQNITHVFIVNRAFPAEKKSYPVRWLIVLVTTVSALFIGVIVIIAVESLTELKNK